MLGIDPSAKLIAAAEAIDAARGGDRRVRHRVAGAADLLAEGERFDVAVVHTVLSHAVDPAALVRQTAALLKPGGLAAFFDMDNASRSIQSDDQALGDAMVAAMRRKACANPTVMRQLPALLRDAGLTLADTQAHCFAEVGHSAYYLGMLDYVTPLVIADGLLPAEQIRAWVAEQHRRSEAGVFFAPGDFFAFIAAKPAR